jgi:hypothetical protein
MKTCQIDSQDALYASILKKPKNAYFDHKMTKLVNFEEILYNKCVNPLVS